MKETTMLKETFAKDVWADADGNIYSSKRKELRKLSVCKVRNDRSKQQYWMTSYGLVHRLVASAFLGDVTGKVINHLDGNTSNNAASNLEITNQKKNCAHALTTGLTPVGEKHSRSKYSDETLLSALREINSGCSVRGIANKYGITQSYLNKVKNKVYRIDLWDKL